MTQENNNLPLLGFIRLLKSHGFDIGVDTHISVQKLLAGLPRNTCPARLKLLLCPVFATDKDKQDLFYQLFDRYFTTFHTVEKHSDQNIINTEKIPSAEKRQSHMRFSFFAFSFVLVVSIVWITAYFGIRQKPVVIKPERGNIVKQSIPATSEHKESIKNFKWLQKNNQFQLHQIIKSFKRLQSV